MHGIVPRRGSAGLYCLLLASLLLADSVAARPKTDSVLLDNGNLISGEIKSLENGILYYKTDAMGTVSIEWEHVAALDSNFFFRVRTEDGKRFFGAIGDTPGPGKMEVLHAGGVENFDVLKVVAIYPIEPGWRERLDTSVSLGYSDFKSSSTTTTNLGFDMRYEDEFSANTLTGRWVINDDDGQTNESSRVDAARQKLFENSVRRYTRMGANWESNDELAIDYRYGLNYGIGRHFIDSNRTRLSATVGLQGLTEEDSSGVSTDSLEGMVILEYSTWRFSSPELDLRTTWRLFPGITESGRYRASADIKLAWEIISDLNFNITAFGNFDSESGEEGDDYDYGITTGVEWEL